MSDKHSKECNYGNSKNKDRNKNQNGTDKQNSKKESDKIAKEIKNKKDIQSDKIDDELDKIKQELEEKQQEAEKYKNLFLRSKADFENYRRRAKRDIQNAQLYAAEDLVIDILSVVDNFERALSSVEDKSDSVYEGVELIYQQLIKILNKHNIKEIEAEGKPFDPRYHQAVMQVETEEYENNTITEVIQKGYLYNSKVIRPSMVKVAKN